MVPSSRFATRAPVRLRLFLFLLAPLHTHNFFLSGARVLASTRPFGHGKLCRHPAMSGSPGIEPGLGDDVRGNRAPGHDSKLKSGPTEEDAAAKALRRVLERRRKVSTAPRARGWYKKKHRSITKAQKRAIDRNWGTFGIDLRFNEVLDLDSYFATTEGTRPHTILDVGFGKGDDLVEMSGAIPDAGFLGIELHRASIACALASLETAKRSNVRVCRGDMTQLLQHHLPPCSLDQVWVFFPDPWMSPSDTERRVIREETVRLLHRCLRQGGQLWLATDVGFYASYVEELLSRPNSGFARVHRCCHRAGDRPLEAQEPGNSVIGTLDKDRSGGVLAGRGDVEGTEQVRPIASSRGSGSSVLSPLHLRPVTLYEHRASTGASRGAADRDVDAEAWGETTSNWGGGVEEKDGRGVVGETWEGQARGGRDVERAEGAGVEGGAGRRGRGVGEGSGSDGGAGGSGNVGGGRELDGEGRETEAGDDAGSRLVWELWYERI